MQRPSAGIFYGWKIGSVACMGNFFLQGSAIYIMNAFIEPLASVYVWSRGDMGLCMGVAALCGTGFMPIVGALALQTSLRKLMTAGAVVGGLSFACMGYTANLWLFTFFFPLFWIAGQVCGGVVGNALMSNWFITARGRALGFVNLGTSLSGILLPFATLLLLRHLSIPQVTTGIGCVILLLGPLSHVLIRDTPESMGLTPDGKAIPRFSGELIEPRDVKWSLLWRSPVCYRIGIAFGLGLLVSSGILSQLKPRFSDLGYNDIAAMLFMCLTAFSAAAGKYR